MGVGLQIQSLLGFYLISLSTKIGVKLKLRLMSFFPVVNYVNLLICIFMNINDNLKNEVKSAQKHLQTTIVASFYIISDTIL